MQTRKLFMNFVFLSLFFSANAIAQSGGPSKKETADYISEHGIDMYSIYSRRKGFTNSNHRLTFTNNYCNINYYDTTKDGTRGSSHAQVKDLIVNILTERYDDTSQYYHNAKQFYIGCANQKCVSLHNEGVKFMESEYFFGFTSHDENQVESLAKAFRHLKNLCTGKKTLF